MKNDSLSRFISLILRHHPEIADVTLDSHGWAKVSDLIAGINKTRHIDMAILEDIVANDKKGRYSFSDDREYIRANQGHSINVDAELEECEPPEILYHGTAEKFTNSIEADGLNSGTRLYVHLSDDYDSAVKVGRRHGKPAVYIVKSGEMFRDGYKFFRSVNGVWMTEKVPAEYLNRPAKS